MNKLLILTLALVILFASCGKPPVYLPEASPGGAVKDNWTYETPAAGPYEGAFKNLSSQLYMEDGALYFDGGLGDGKLVPMRLNLATGNLTAVCPDPVCAHDTTECPLYGTRDFLPIEFAGHTQYLVLRRYYDQRQTLTGWDPVRIEQLERYDPTGGKSVVLETYDGNYSLGPEVYLGQYRFYMSSDYDEEGKWVGGLTRMNLENGRRELLWPQEDAMPLLAKDGRVWASNGGELFSFDGLAEDPASTRRTEREGLFPLTGTFSTDGINLYYPSAHDGMLRVVPLDGGEEAEIDLPFAKGYGIVTAAGGWLTYFSGGDTDLGKADIRGYASTVVELNGEEFRRCRPDGSEDQCVFRFEGEYASFRPLHIAADGRYLYCTYSWWEDPDGDGVYRDGDQHYSFPVNGHDNCSLLRIDCETGEAKIITIREGTK